MSNSTAVPLSPDSEPEAIVAGLVERARAAVLENGGGGEEEKEDRAVKECKADRPPPPLVQHASPERRLGAALLAHGRALALMGQHVGLGAYTYGTVRGAGCNELFETGCKALLDSEDVCGAAGDERGAALAMAARGELLYCAASAGSRGRAPSSTRPSPPWTRSRG